MTATKEYLVGVAGGVSLPIATGNKRIRVETASPGVRDLATLVVQADAYEISISGALTILAGRLTVLALAPSAWTTIQPREMERAS